MIAFLSKEFERGLDDGIVTALVLGASSFCGRQAALPEACPQRLTTMAARLRQMPQPRGGASRIGAAHSPFAQ